MDIVNLILTFWFTGLIGLFLYWCPLSICIVGYTLRTFENFQKDLRHRKEYLDCILNEDIKNIRCHYSPTDTIGTLIGRALVSLTPVANLWAAMFDISPKLFHKLFYYIERLFDIPLVPPPAPKPEK